MMLKRCVYLVKSDEGKYLVVYLNHSDNKSRFLTDQGDEPLEYYHVDGIKIAVSLSYYFIPSGYKMVTKVFSNYQQAIDYLNKEVI